MLPVIELNSKIWLFLNSEQRLLQLAQQITFEFIILPFHSGTFSSKALAPHLQGQRQIPFSLSDIYGFNEMMQNVSRCSSKVKIICAGVDPVQQVAIAFLLGCHLIMSNGLGFEEAYLPFRPLYATIEQCFGNVAFTSSLRALCCVKCLNWIDFRKDPIDESQPRCIIDMEEFIHYSRHGCFYLYSMLHWA